MRECSVFTSQNAANNINNIDLGCYKMSYAPSLLSIPNFLMPYSICAEIYKRRSDFTHKSTCRFCVQTEKPRTLRGKKCRIALKCYHIAYAFPPSGFDCSRNGRTFTLQIIGPFFIMNVLVYMRTPQPSVFNSIPIKRKLNVCPPPIELNQYKLVYLCYANQMLCVFSPSFSLCLSVFSLLVLVAVPVCMFGKYKQIFVVCAHKTGKINVKHRHHYHNLDFGIESLYLNRKPIE